MSCDFGVQSSKSFFLAARNVALLALVKMSLLKAGWNKASRAWLGVSPLMPGNLPLVISVV